MSSNSSFEQALAFVNTQLKRGSKPAASSAEGPRFTAVTISRQAGSGAHTIGEQLASWLQANTAVKGRPWTVFDRNLVEKVLEDHHLPARLATYLPEDRISELQDTIDEFFGLRPQSWKLVEQTSQTVLRLCELGNVIIIGRGGNVITRRLPHVLHVRLVGSLEKRVDYLMATRQVSQKAAAKLVAAEDLGRARYLRKYFQADIDDPTLYHLVLNTDLIPYEAATALIGRILLKGF